MIPMFILQQFTKKIDFLITAIVEELEGKVPSEEDKRTNVKTSISPNEGKTTIYWKDMLILEAILTEDSEGDIQGYFNLPEQFANNEYIQEKVNKWNS